MSERLEAMKRFVEQFPDDPFPRYALALEYRSAGRLDEAVETFRELRVRNPAYVATYLQLGYVLRDLGRVEEARTVLEEGVAAAQAAGNRHAQGEIEDALSELED